MSAQTSVNLNPKARAMLDCLQQAVADALERKRRLGHYAVFWRGRRSHRCWRGCSRAVNGT